MENDNKKSVPGSRRKIQALKGTLPLMLSRKIFNLDQFTKDKILSICAVIRADLGADPNPQATKIALRATRSQLLQIALRPSES